MKIMLSLLSILLLACTAPKPKIPTGILSKKKFINILKEVHLAEAKFELYKTKGIENAKNELAHNYSAIYEKHAVTMNTFDKTINYYTQHPEQLEKIYTRVLEQLKNDRTILDQQ